jgi:tRNA A37 threonylcarbamoyladenosine dehydratase
MSYKFPLYRRYLHGNTYYRINSHENFDELMVIGKFFVYKNFQARILPEYQLIIDLIDNVNNRWELIDSADFEKKLDYCKNNLNEKKLD